MKYWIPSALLLSIIMRYNGKLLSHCEIVNKMIENKTAVIWRSPWFNNHQQQSFTRHHMSRALKNICSTSYYADLSLAVIWMWAKNLVQSRHYCLIEYIKAHWRHFTLVGSALTHPEHLSCAKCTFKAFRWPCCEAERPVKV